MGRKAPQVMVDFYSLELTQYPIFIAK